MMMQDVNAINAGWICLLICSAAVLSGARKTSPFRAGMDNVDGVAVLVFDFSAVFAAVRCIA
jgi:hypothetical protein